MRRFVKTLFIGALFAISATQVMGQDLLARQAPIDRKMKTVDTIMLRNIAAREEMESPAAKLYDDWDNKYAHRATEMPSRYRIDLRHFCMPTPSRVVTSNFGWRWGRNHKGLDIKVYIGDTIRAAFSGKVRIVRYERGGYGNYVVIRHNNGLETIYAHMSKNLVKENQVVRAGEAIGLGGNTGRSTGSHLHFETRLCGVALNPALMFDFREQDVTGDYYVYNKDTYEEESREATRLRGKIGNGGYTDDEVKGIDSSEKDSKFEGKVLYHKVTSGETLESIARKYGVSVDEICRLNRIRKTMRIRAGQILRYS